MLNSLLGNVLLLVLSVTACLGMPEAVFCKSLLSLAEEPELYSVLCADRSSRSRESLATVKDVVSDTHLLLFTLSNPDVAQEMKVSDASTLGAFNGSKPTKIVVHGFGEGVDDTPWMTDMKNAFLAKEDVNVILVDWAKLAVGNDYPGAVLNTKIVGTYVATLVDWLVSSEGASSEDFHLVGFSLGAHVVGFCGKAVTTGKLSRISGLDPAYPFFEAADSTGRLDVTDAHFVDVIHANSGPLLEGGLSFLQPLGHVDFYPNGGRRQPECGNLLESIVDIFTHGFDGACSHNRAPQLFLESIENPLAFPVYPCADYDTYTTGNCTICEADFTSTSGECLRMGSNAVKPADSSNTSAIFYLSTRGTKPFHGRPVFFRMSMSPLQVPTRGFVHVNLTGSSGPFNDCPILLNEEQTMDAGVEVFAARNVILELEGFEEGVMNFTQRAGGTEMMVDSFQVFDQLTTKRVCYNEPIIGLNHTLIYMNFTTC